MVKSGKNCENRGKNCKNGKIGAPPKKNPGYAPVIFTFSIYKEIVCNYLNFDIFFNKLNRSAF